MLIKQVIEFKLMGPGTPGHRVARRPGDPAPIEMLSITKMWQKSLLFLPFQFLLALFAYNAFF